MSISLVVAGKAQREPFLRLAAVFAVPGLADDLARDIVLQPFGDFAEAFDGADIGFLAQFPQRRRPWLFALSMPPCGICQACVASMCSGPSMRRPMKASPARLSTSTPTQGR